MNEQMSVNFLEPMIDTSLHNMCVRLGGITLGKYSALTGERTDHLLIEFLRKDHFKTVRSYGKN